MFAFRIFTENPSNAAAAQGNVSAVVEDEEALEENLWELAAHRPAGPDPDRSAEFRKLLLCRGVGEPGPGDPRFPAARLRPQHISGGASSHTGNPHLPLPTINFSHFHLNYSIETFHWVQKSLKYVQNANT